MEIESLKREAAVAAAAEIRDGMRLGLGTGSTVSHLLDVLGERVREGLRVTGVPTSARTEAHARRLGIPLATLEETPELDLCIDGADEVDPGLDCLKGLGGACVREKVVAAASGRFVLIVDETKLVRRLGERAPVVVETIPFAVPTVMRALRAHNPVLRAALGVAAAASAADAVSRFESAGAGPPALRHRQRQSPPGAAHRPDRRSLRAGRAARYHPGHPRPRPFSRDGPRRLRRLGGGVRKLERPEGSPAAAGRPGRGAPGLTSHAKPGPAGPVQTGAR